ncbi:hypothetical protein GC163_10630 [bacterium]|nr:hypothetical protein [bacterium]
MMQSWLPGLLSLTILGTVVVPVDAGDHWPWRWNRWGNGQPWGTPMGFPEMYGAESYGYDAWVPEPMTAGPLGWEAEYLPENACCEPFAMESGCDSGITPQVDPRPNISPTPTPSPSPTPIPDDGFRPHEPDGSLPPSQYAPPSEDRSRPVAKPVETPVPVPADPPAPMTEPVPMPDLNPMPDFESNPIQRKPPRRSPLPSPTSEFEVTPEISIPMPPMEPGFDPLPEAAPGTTTEPATTSPSNQESLKPEIPRNQIPFPRDASRQSAPPWMRRPVPGAARAWMSRPDAVVR